MERDPYELTEEEIAGRYLGPNPTKELFLKGYKYSFRKHIEARFWNALDRLWWRARWGLAEHLYGERFIGFYGGRPFLKKEQ